MRVLIPISLRLLGIFGLGVFGFGDAVAETPEKDTAATVSIAVENDLFGSGTDRHFTHGTKFLYTTPEYLPKDSEPIAYIAEMIPFWPMGARARASYGLGQNIYTPDDISDPNPRPGDRPYAGWLYLSGGLIVLSDEGRRSDAMNLDLGIVGPASLAEATQRTWHKWFGFQKPRGWDNQLKNEPGFILTYEHQRQFLATTLPLGLNADIVPNAGFALGNVMTYLSGGVTVRIGADLTTDLGPPRIRPSLPGSAYIRKAEGFNWYGFASLGGRLVGRNIFLDGNTFADSLSVDKRWIVGDLQTGVALQYEDWRLAYTYVIRTEEFANQDTVDRFGSLNLSFRF